MTSYEYKVVPAPTRGQKAKGVKTGEDRFALGIEILMNDLASEGWEYQRAETLPSVERAGLTGTSTEWRNILVFRRALFVNDYNSVHAAPHAGVTPLVAPVREPDLHSEPESESTHEIHDPAVADEATEIERLRNTLYPRKEPKLTDNSEA